MDEDPIEHARGFGLAAQPRRLGTFARDQQLQPGPGARDREEREQEVLVPALGAVARRGRDHPANCRIEHRREDRGGPQVVLHIEQAAQHAGRGRGRAFRDQCLPYRGAGTERPAAHPRRPRRQRSNVGAPGMQDDRHVEQPADEGGLEVVLPRMDERRSKAIQLAGEPDDAVARYAVDAVPVLAQRLAHRAVRRADERNPANEVSHVSRPPRRPAGERPPGRWGGARNQASVLGRCRRSASEQHAANR